MIWRQILIQHGPALKENKPEGANSGHSFLLIHNKDMQAVR